MIRALIICVLVLTVGQQAAGQTTVEPQVTFALESEQVIPGQAADLRITVLVPTWMTKPVLFPSFEAPNLSVRLPEGATNPVSQSVAGETWSGISRRYRIMPMVPGRFEIPAQELIVTWADPETNAPREDRVGIDPVVISGVLPEGAEGLDPFIGATSLTLTQDVVRGQEPLKPGDSVTRTVTAMVEGTSPMFLPSLIPTPLIEGIATYPSEPVLTENETRGTLSGTRVEQITYLAQTGGNDQADSITLEWFNLDSGQVETATVDAISLVVDAPVKGEISEMTLRMVVLAVVVLLAFLSAMLTFRKRLLSYWRRSRAERHARILASEAYARTALSNAIRARDYDAVIKAMDVWRERLPHDDPLQDTAIRTALDRIGAELFGPSKIDTSAASWSQLETALRHYRRKAPRAGAMRALPPLNPASYSGRRI